MSTFFSIITLFPSKHRERERETLVRSRSRWSVCSVWLEMDSPLWCRTHRRSIAFWLTNRTRIRSWFSIPTSSSLPAASPVTGFNSLSIYRKRGLVSVPKWDPVDHFCCC